MIISCKYLALSKRLLKCFPQILVNMQLKIIIVTPAHFNLLYNLRLFVFSFVSLYITMIFTIGSTNLFCKVLKGSVKFTHFIGVKFNVIGRILRDVKLCFSFLRFLCRGHKNNHFLHLYTFSRAFNIFDKNFFFCRNRGINI